MRGDNSCKKTGNKKYPQNNSVAQWLVRWAAVRQPRVRIPPGTPPSAQQDELFTQTQEFIPSSGRYPAGKDQPEDEY